MRFNTRMSLYAVIPAVLFLAALCVGLWGMKQSSSGFVRFLDHEQRLAQDLSDMYAQGLQTGQALRNIVLDPGNGKAYTNLQEADAAFAAALDSAQAAADTGMKVSLARLADLRATHKATQGKVMDLVKADVAAATRLLVSGETPAWRALRAELVEQVKKARAVSAEVRADAVRTADLVQMLALALGAAAAASSVVFTWLERRALDVDLGGDPRQACEAMQRLAAGDLATGVPGRQGVMGELEKMRLSLAAIVRDVRQGSETILHASTEIASGVMDLSSRTEQTAANLQRVASSMEQISGTVKSTADTADKASTMAAGNAHAADDGGRVMGDVVANMDSIGQSSARISDIIGTIDGIAFQTNILALNAAVEAARAGDAGRGFAVVASEVRTLAQRSSAASREIKTLIQTSVEQVQTGSAVVARARQAIDRVVADTGRVHQLIDDIATGAKEQSLGVRQIGDAAQELDHSTQSNAALVEQTAAACANLRERALALSDRVSVFRVPVA